MSTPDPQQPDEPGLDASPADVDTQPDHGPAPDTDADTGPADVEQPAPDSSDSDTTPPTTRPDVQAQLERALTAERRLAELEAQMTRFDVAVEAGLPLAFARRLVGTSREEMTADASVLRQQLLVHVHARTGPTTAPRALS